MADCPPGGEPVRAEPAHSRVGQETALLVVDLQQALCDAAPAAAMDLVTERIAALRARPRGLESGPQAGTLSQHGARDSAGA